MATEPVDFLVNISNDGWFDGTEEHEQHLAICRFRAIETRRSVVRAVNMGISAVIDPDGRVIELPRKLDEQGQPTIPAQSWSGSKKVEGVVLSAVPIDTRQTLYARLGDWVAGGVLGWRAGGCSSVPPSAVEVTTQRPGLDLRRVLVHVVPVCCVMFLAHSVYSGEDCPLEDPVRRLGVGKSVEEPREYLSCGLIAVKSDYRRWRY